MILNRYYMMQLLLLLIFLLFNGFSYAIAQENYDFNNDDSYVMLKSDHEDDDLSYNFSTIKKIDLRSLGIMPCKEVPLVFDKCITSVCSIATKFGSVLVSIKKTPLGMCQYSERSPTVGEIGCVFPASELFDVYYLFNKRFDKMAQEDSGVIFTEDDTKKLSDLVRNYCKSIKTNKQGQLVTINSPVDENNNVFDDQLKDLQEIAQAQKVVSSKKKSADKRPGSVTQELSLQNFKTIMFTTQEIGLLNKFLTNNSEHTQDNLEASYASYLTSGPGRFRLDSIVHEANGKWAIWLNGIRYDDHSLDKVIKVMNVGSDNVTVRWNAINLDRVAPDWQERAVTVSENKYEIGNNITIEFADDTTYIYFTIKAGQVFDAHSLKVFETRKY